ncbi:MAG: exonuclease domain-containing protein [Desulfobacteraceae bacterium]|nr:exonuclease domain-containing protein [Desulfobacteraceae bacterium]
MKTFLFYDVETSGLNPAFDQILTFASIRTDLNLREINRQSVVIQLRKDIIPSPKAFLTHGLTTDELAIGIHEYEAALKIHKLVNTPETISLGYNSLGFDDEFLRLMFYRNLLDPYSHQYSNGCSRMDILPITVVYRIFHADIINWPEIDGKPSLKLDLISDTNHLATSGRAHEAMNDVESLIELSKKLFRQKKTWHYCLDFFSKTKEEARINAIKSDFQIQDRYFRICIMISLSFGSKVNYMTPVIHIGQSLPYKNQSLWLRLDSETIPGLGDELNAGNAHVIRKRPGDGLILLPALERFWNRMPASTKQFTDENLKRICKHWEKFFDFIHFHLEYRYPLIPDIDPDASLYQDGFFSGKEKKECDLFHLAGKDQKYGIVDRIQSPRIKVLANRILDRNFSKGPLQAASKEYQSHLDQLRSVSEANKIKGYRGDTKYSRYEALEELKELESTLLDPGPDQKKMLAWLNDYIKGF